MTTITLENVPANIKEEYGSKIDYNILVSYINMEKSKKLEAKFYNSKEDNYGPFNGSKEAIDFLTRNRGL